MGNGRAETGAAGKWGRRRGGGGGGGGRGVLKKKKKRVGGSGEEITGTCFVLYDVSGASCQFDSEAFQRKIGGTDRREEGEGEGAGERTFTDQGPNILNNQIGGAVDYFA